jgi:hypothetical protein
MAQTILFISSRDSSEFNYTKELSEINFHGDYMKFTMSESTPVDEELLWKDDPSALFFISDREKVFITLMNGPYHFFIDSLGPLLQQLEKTPDALFIIDTGNMYDPDKSYLDFFTNALRTKGVDFRLIKANNLRVFANNFYTQAYMDNGYNAPNRLYNFYKDFITNPEVKPFRKVYVSRSAMPPRPIQDAVPGASFDHDNRIDDEKKLESYLESLGFEIIVPEKDFKSFDEQLNYFYEVKTLISVTSGGITNSSFMQPGGTVVELVNSMIVPMGGVLTPEKGQLWDVEEALHHYYSVLSWQKSHNYIGIDNSRRSADFIIDKINNSTLLQSILKD